MGKGHGDPAKERGLPFLPRSFWEGVASWASWKTSRSSDRSQTCSPEGCVSCLLPGFWNPSQLLATDPSPSSQDGRSLLSIHHPWPSSYPPASASVGSSMSHMSHRCLCSANSHRGRPVWGSLGRHMSQFCRGLMHMGSWTGVFGYGYRLYPRSHLFSGPWNALLILWSSRVDKAS